jgi:hypothetical protein
MSFLCSDLATCDLHSGYVEKCAEKMKSQRFMTNKERFAP